MKISNVVRFRRQSGLKQISSLREQMENLNDYLDLLEARAQQGKAHLHDGRNSQTTGHRLKHGRQQVQFIL